ncbi:hypothetical protein J2Y55_003709 [Bosea sp. BE125]|nr:hypothetical protein [Bosea sp. BE125]
MAVGIPAALTALPAFGLDIGLQGHPCLEKISESDINSPVRSAYRTVLLITRSMKATRSSPRTVGEL